MKLKSFPLGWFAAEKNMLGVWIKLVRVVIIRLLKQLLVGPVGTVLRL